MIDDIFLQYNQLNDEGKKQLKNFLKSLLSKNAVSKNSPGNSYQQNLLKVSNWSDEDIKMMQENAKHFNDINPSQW